jgi:hypothetical protein
LSFAAYFAPNPPEYAAFYPNHWAKPSVFAIITSDRDGKLSDLRLRVDPPGVPFPWPFMAQKIEAAQTVISPLDGAVCRRMPVQRVVRRR